MRLPMDERKDHVLLNESKKLLYIVTSLLVLASTVALVYTFYSKERLRVSTDLRADAATLPTPTSIINEVRLPKETCPEDLLLKDLGRFKALYKGKELDIDHASIKWVESNCDLVSGKRSEKPVLTNLGIDFAEYDKSTGKAGDFVFPKTLQKNWDTTQAFLEFGAKIKVTGGEKTVPDIEWLSLDPQTDVQAVTDGFVMMVQYQSDTKDFEVVMQPSLGSTWQVIYDHVIDVELKSGQRVSAGEVIGKVSLSKDGKVGRTELQINENISREQTMVHCPLELMDEAVVNNHKAKIATLIKDWETVYKNKSIFKEETSVVPGCSALKLNYNSL